jgi:hypothetical protein
MGGGALTMIVRRSRFPSFQTFRPPGSHAPGKLRSMAGMEAMRQRLPPETGAQVLDDEPPLFLRQATSGNNDKLREPEDEFLRSPG